MKKTISMRISVFLLACLMLVTSLTACQEGTDPTKENPTSEQPVRDVVDSLPELNFGGKSVTFLYGVLEDDPNYSKLGVDSLKNDALNDQIYNREYRVEERLGVKINFRQDTDVTEKAKNSILSTLDEYQIVGNGYLGFVPLASDGLFNNLLDTSRVEHLDLTKPYWSDLWTKNAEMYAQSYFATGALSTAFVKSTNCVFFNKEMVKNAGVDNLYKVVEDGDWTLDYMLNMIKGSYVDVTGNGKTDDDTYGFLFDDSRVIDAFWSAFDLTCITRDNDGNPVLTKDSMNIEKMNKVTDTIRKLERDYADIWCYDTMQYYEQNIVCEDLNIAKFARNEAMLLLSNIYMTERTEMRDMSNDYGIIPLPKFDEYQKDYYSYNPSFSVFGIPTTVKELSMVSAVLEALASDSYSYVAPVYYNKVLNGRYMRDPESSEMLDRIVETTTIDFGWIYDREIAKIAEESLRYFIRENDYSFSTYWRQNSRRYINAFDKLVEKYQKMANFG